MSSGASGAFVVGGLVGQNSGTVEMSYTTGSVDGATNVGGLVGQNTGTVEKSYSTATVVASGGTNAGGLVGANFTGGTVESSYATGSVTGEGNYNSVGGLVGVNYNLVETSYATGAVSGNLFVGGVVGDNGGTVETSYWAQDVGLNAGLFGIGSSSSNAGATPESVAAMELQSTFIPAGTSLPDWDFTNTWSTNGNSNSPQLIGLPQTPPPGTSGVDTLSGTAYTNSGVTFAALGTLIDLIFDGTSVGSTMTNGSGGFSFSISSGDLTGGILLTDATDKGNTYYQITSPQSIITGIDLWGNTLRVLADTASNTALGTAAGSLNATTYGINYSVNAAALATNSGVNMSILDNFTQDGIVSAYTLNGNITAGGALTTSANSALTASSSVQLTGNSVTLAGSVSSGGTLSVDSTSGDITIDNGTVTASNANFTAAGNLNITEPSEEIALGGAVTTPGGSGGYVDITNGTTITAQSATLSADGPLFIVGTTITLNGGDLTASGNGYTNATDTDKIDGIDIYNSTINAQGGNISLTGNAGYSNVSGVESAGYGVLIGNASTIETSGSGNITIAATVNQNIDSQSGLDAFSIYGTGNSITGGSGLISITGNVLQGTADGPAEYGANVSGIEIGGGASVTATGAGGSISLTGNVSGANSVVSGANFGFSSGIEIGGATGAGTALSIVGPNAGVGGTLTLNGTGSSLDATDYTGTGNNNPFSVGTTIDSGAQVSGGAASTISITGTESPGTTGTNIGMVGAMINGGAEVQITGTGGTINITGTTSAATVVSIGSNNSYIEGVEIDPNNTLAPVVSVAGSGSITITGTAGTVNTSSSTLTNSSINNLPGSLGSVITSDAEIVTGINSTLNIIGTGGAVTTTSAFTGDSEGVYLDDATEISMDTGATLSLTGFGGAVNAGNGANASDAGTRGVDIEGNIAVATGGGITITGTGGSIDISNASSITGSQFPGTEGVYMGGNSDLAASGTTTLTLMGTGGTVTAGSNLIGDSIGVDIGNNQPNTGNNQAKSNLISAGSGLIKITGVAGTTPSLGIGVDIFGLGLGSTSIESTSCNIAITGTGGSGYTGTGTVVGNYIPNDGVAVADNSTLTTGGTGTISFTGTGGSNSSGVEVIELTNDTTLDADPTAPAITSGAALSITSLAGTNISITDANVFAPNATITAAGKLSISDQQIALGGVGSYGVGVQIKNGTTITATSANLASTGNLTIQDSSITLSGGNFTGTGTGYISSTDSAGIVYGINVIGSTINAQGGNISLTGAGGYFLGSGELIEAGDGINIYDDSNNTTIETSGTGNISLLGSFNHNITTYSGLAGVSVGDGSSGTITISVAQGALSINGTVSQGTFGDGTTAQLNGQGGIEGVNIVGAVIEATGTGGSVSITGNTTGTKAFDNATGGSSQNEGISINYSNSPTSTISVGTNGTLTLSGTAGTLDSTYAASFSNTGRSVGLDISTGTQITGGTGATLSLTGTGGSVVTNDAGSAATDTSYTGQTEGFFIGDSDSVSSISQVSVGGGGSIHITGTAGSIDVSNDATPPNHEDPDANGVQVTNGTQITAAGTSTITIQGTGGTVTAGSNIFGGAGGVNISGGSSTGLNTLITSASGQITIIGIGGTAPNKGLGVLVAGTDGVTSKIESTSGNISITGTGGNGYNGDNIIVANYVPNYGVLVADAATVMTGGSGTISLTGTGGSISTGVEIVELTNDSTIDTAPVLPTITAGSAFTANALSGTGINVNGTITADGVTLGTGTTGNFASITSGNLVINNATITLTGGNFTAFGKGNFPYGSDVDGVDVFSSTINAAGGTINITGQGTTFVYDESGGVAALDGLNIAGQGTLIDLSTLETTGTSGITVYGDASVGSTTVQNALIGLQDDSSNLSVVNGVITLTGTVNSGTALSTSVASSAGLSDNGIVGTLISLDVDTPVSSISATGASGAIAIIGNVSGSTSDGSEFSSDNRNDDGVVISGTGLTISSAGNGVAFVNGGTTYNGIYIQGTGGNIINNQTGSGGDSGAEGVGVNDGALVEGTGAAQISLLGQGGSNTTSPSGTVTGSAAGIVIETKAGSSAPDNGDTQVTTASGSISLVGTAGTTPDKGIGIAIDTQGGGVTRVGSTSGTITLKGLGGPGNTAGLTTFGSGSTQTDLPNDGVGIFGDSILQTGSTGGISVTGSGRGAEGAAILMSQGGETTGPSLIASSGPLSLTTLSSGVGDIVLDNDTLPSTSSYNGTSVTLNTQGNGAVVLTNTNIQLNDAPITINGTSVSANTSVVQSTYTTGVEIIGSTIDTGGGNISLTGQASYAYDASVTGNLAGEGIFIGGSTVETASSLQSSITSGNITVNGNGSIGANTVVNVITGVEINSSTVSLANGTLSITGDANSGIADNENNPEAVSNNQDGPTGVFIQDGSVVEATGTGSIAVTGDASGSTSDLSGATTGGGGDSIGVHVDGFGSGNIISVAGGTGGITITGTGGNTINGSSTIGAISEGIDLYNGTTITAGGAAPITLTGTGGTNTPTTGQVVGGSFGVGIIPRTGDTDHPDSTVAISSGSGAIQITGFGGTTPSAGDGIFALGENGGTVTIESTSGAITFTGTGGSGNTGQASTSTSSLGAIEPNDGITVLDGVTVQTNALVTFTGAGAGTGADGVVIDQYTNGSITTGSDPLIGAGTNTLNIVSTSGDIVYGGTGTAGSPVVGAAVLIGSAGNVAINTPVSSSNGVVQVSGNVIDLNAEVNSTNGNILFVDHTQFVNTVGSSALSTSNGFDWQVWSVNPAGSGQSTVDTDDSLTPNYIQYGATYGITTPLGTGNGLLYSYAPAALAVTLSGTFTKTYDSTLNMTIASGSYSIGSTGLVSGDAINVTTSGALNGTLNSKDVATATTVTVVPSQISYDVTQAGIPVYGYTISSVSAPATVTAATLTASLTGAVDKVYDSTTTATLSASNYNLSGVFGGDTVVLNDPVSGTYDTKDVATGKTVTVMGLALSGAQAGDYTIGSTTTSGAIGAITPATLTANLTGTVAKTYDGTTTATLTASNYDLTGTVYNGDTVTLNDPTSGTYDTAMAGTGKTVTVSGLALLGPSNADYTLAGTTVSGAVGTIDQAGVVIASLTGNVTKVYDGTDSVVNLTNSNYILSGVVNGDTVIVSGPTTGTYASVNVGTGIMITSSTGLTLSGAQASNYTLGNTQASGLIGTITPATLTVTANPETVTYSATGFSGGNGVTYSGFKGTDNAASLGGTLAYTGTSQGAINVGTYVITPGGYTVGNYTYAYNNGTLTINPAQLIVSANPETVTYSTNAFSGGNGVTYSGFQGSDNATSLAGTLSYTGTAQGAVNAGTYTITPGGYTAGNYTYVYNNGALTISPAQLTVTANPETVTYSANAFSGGNGVTYSGFQGSDNATSLAGTLTYTGTSQGAVNAGTYAITPGGYTVGNYNYVYNNGTLTINPALLTVTANPDTATYSATGFSGGNGATYSGFKGSDNAASLGGTLTYTGSSQGAVNAGTYVITPSGYTVGNYTYAYNSGTLTINPAQLTVTANPETVTYSANAFSGGNGVTYSGFQGSDNATSLAGTLTYTGTSQGAVNAGTYAITPGGYTVGNYNYVYNNGTLTIAPALLTVTLSGAVSKTYDSTTAATLTGSDYNLGGVLGNDIVALNDPTSGTYDTKDVGTSKVVTVTGLALSGAQAADYTLGTATASGAIGTITPATLTPSLTGTVSKVYDGTTVSALNPANVSLATVFNGDSVGVSGTVSYGQTKDVSSNDAVAISGLTLTGPGAGDYQLSTSNLSGNTGAITPATLTYVATPVTIDYGATIPALSGMVTGFAAGDTLSSVTSGTLSFTTQATAMSDAGSYAITGMGLTPTSSDYLLAQSGANAMALTILAPPTTVTTTTISTTTGGADNGQSNIVPPAITPQTTVITTPPAVVSQTTATPPPVNMTGQVGTINQPVVTTTTFADSSGNSGQVGSGDVAQLNNGELNNVANPHATSALNEALGPVVYHTLSDALQAAGDFTDAYTTGATDDTAAAGAGDGETILTGGEVAEVSDDGAKKIPLSQAPVQLRNALAGDVLHGVASGH
jgi:hypothetical protein